MSKEVISHLTDDLRCIECNGKGLPFLRHPSVREFFRCAGCGLIFADPKAYQAEADYRYDTVEENPTQEQRKHFSEVFSEGIDTSDAEGNMYHSFGISQQEMEAGLFTSIEQALRKHAHITKEDAWHVLDVGCATGFLLDIIRRHYPRVQLAGVEPSPCSRTKALRLYGIDVHQGTMNTFPAPPNPFELVTIMGNLQLHENPFATLKKCHELLAAGGLLIYQMKNPRSLARMLAVLASRCPVICNWRITSLALERGFLCMRFAASKKYLASATRELGFELLEVTTYPPRMLAYGQPNRAHRRGWLGAAWRILDRIDCLRNEQAWIQVCARKPGHESVQRAA